MAGFRFSLDFDSRLFKRGSEEAAQGVEDVADALDQLQRDGARDLDDVAGSLDRVGTAASDAAREVETELGDARRETVRDADRIGDSFRDAFQGAREDARQAARDIKRAVEDNAIDAEDVYGAEVRAEVMSNAAESGAEVARGFKDGFGAEDMETILDGVTDTMVAVGTVGGPAGIAAGLAGASLVQAIGGPLIAGAQEQAEQLQETYASAFTNIVAEGEELGRELTISQSVGKIAEDMDKLNGAIDTANALGIERGVVLRAMAGDETAYNLVLAAQKELTDPLVQSITELGEAAKEQKGMTSEQAAGMLTLTNELEAARELTDGVTSSYNTNTDALGAATEATRAKAEADRFAAESAIKNAQETAKQTGEQQDLEVTIDGVSRAFRAMPDGKVVEVTDDGTVRRTQRQIDGISGTTVGVEVTVDRAQAQRAVDGTVASLQQPRIVARVVPGRVREV